MGVYKTFDDALHKIKEEIKGTFDDDESMITEKTYDGKFMNGYRNLYDFRYDGVLLYSIFEIKV
jgi:hypothetical protein